MQTPTVLITGASSGIGLELTRLCAAQGYDLIIVARSREKLERLAEVLRSQAASILVLEKDLSQPNAGHELYQAIRQQGRTVDILINDAGYGLHGRFMEIDIAQQLNMMQLNMLTLTELTYLVLQDMQARRWGRILNLGSVASFVPVPMFNAYSATKAFVLSFTTALTTELMGYGDIHVTALCPGPTKTRFAENSRMDRIDDFNRFAATPQNVARAGWQGLLKKKNIVVTGGLFRFGLFLNWLAPRWLVQKVLGLGLLDSAGEEMGGADGPA